MAIIFLCFLDIISHSYYRYVHNLNITYSPRNFLVIISALTNVLFEV